MTQLSDAHDQELLRSLDPLTQTRSQWRDLHAVGAVEVLLPMSLDEREQLPTVSSGLAEEGEPMTMVFARRAPSGDLATVEVRMPGEQAAIKALQRGVLPSASVRVQEVIGTGALRVDQFARRCVVADESVVPSDARVMTVSPGLHAALRATAVTPSLSPRLRPTPPTRREAIPRPPGTIL